MGNLRDTTAKYDLFATRVMSYVNEANNNAREIEWVVDELEQNKISRWNSIIDLGQDDIEEVVSPDLVNETRYEILTPSAGGNVDLHLENGTFFENGNPSTATSNMYTKTSYVSIEDREAFNYNDLMIFKNGVLQDKKNGEDVVFIEKDVIRFVLPLDTKDIILVRKQVGL